MTTEALSAAGLDPDRARRRPGELTGAATRKLGGDRLFVVEADEYDQAFLTLPPDGGGGEQRRGRSPRVLRQPRRAGGGVRDLRGAGRVRSCSAPMIPGLDAVARRLSASAARLAERLDLAESTRTI